MSHHEEYSSFATSQCILGCRTVLILTDARTPAFLQRLKGQFGAVGERQNVQFGRPRKQLLDLEDDAPTYIDEDNNEMISKEDFESMSKPMAKSTSDKSKIADYGEQNSNEAKSRKQSSESLTAFGSSNKRKAAKIVAGDEAEAGLDPADSKAASSSKKVDAHEGAMEPAKKVKLAKKAKRIKLSFDEDNT